MKRTELKRHTPLRSKAPLKHTPWKRTPDEIRAAHYVREHQRALAKRKLIKECDAIVRALALERDGRCVVPDCKHPMDNLQVSHIYPKGKYPLLRFDLDNVEIRCAGHHKFQKGSPHGDPAGFAMWLNGLPRKRMAHLQREAAKIGRADILWLRQTYQDLLTAYEQTFGTPWNS